MRTFHSNQMTPFCSPTCDVNMPRKSKQWAKNCWHSNRLFNPWKRHCPKSWQIRLASQRRTSSKLVWLSANLLQLFTVTWWLLARPLRHRLQPFADGQGISPTDTRPLRTTGASFKASSVSTDETVARVKELVDADPRISCEYIASELELSSATAFCILKHTPCYKKVCSVGYRIFSLLKTRGWG